MALCQWEFFFLAYCTPADVYMSPRLPQLRRTDKGSDLRPMRARKKRQWKHLHRQPPESAKLKLSTTKQRSIESPTNYWLSARKWQWHYITRNFHYAATLPPAHTTAEGHFSSKLEPKRFLSLRWNKMLKWIRLLCSSNDPELRAEIFCIITSREEKMFL